RAAFSQMIPVYFSEVPNAKTGYWKETGGAIQFSPFVSSRLMVFEPVNGSAGMVVLGLPELGGRQLSDQARSFLMVRIKPQGLVTSRIFLDGKSADLAFSHHVDNVLEAYPVLTPWSAS